MEAVQSPDRLLRITDVAERLAVTRQHVYRLISDGELTTITIGVRKIRIAESDLQKFIDTRRRSHTPRS